MKPVSLAPDCSRCAALCCITLAFDKSDHFALDKPAGVPCPNLNDQHLCEIHDRLEHEGFSGCVRYNCSGAGQRVTQEVFGGTSWHTDPSLLASYLDAFRIMRKLHDLLVVLEGAKHLPLSPEDQDVRNTLLNQLSPTESWTLESLISFDQGDLQSKANVFFKTLKRYITAR
ncbi:hypothetical protein [Actibacterium lipolyticum]|uniref:hypothetical protein n=1 Tax=Actibacterium lipolyticum TaxID=1524263 RepID=UPI000BB45770|nr:hypothetical protein [Actibacterium lipolyticum]